MNRFLVFVVVSLMGVSLRFGADWSWWADLILILLTALLVAALPREERA